MNNQTKVLINDKIMDNDSSKRIIKELDEGMKVYLQSIRRFSLGKKY